MVEILAVEARLGFFQEHNKSFVGLGRQVGCSEPAAEDRSMAVVQVVEGGYSVSALVDTMMVGVLIAEDIPTC